VTKHLRDLANISWSLSLPIESLKTFYLSSVWKVSVSDAGYTGFPHVPRTIVGQKFEKQE